MFGLVDAHSPNADEIRTVIWVMLAAGAAFAVIAHAGLLGALLGKGRADADEAPPQTVSGAGLQFRVAGLLSLAAAAIFVFGIVSTREVREVSPSGERGLAGSETAQAGELSLPAGAEPLVIRAVAQQWVWRFEYPGGRPGDVPFSYGELVVPVDTAVVLEVDSTDVLHRWFVPALGGQVDAMPGRVTKTWFRADEKGIYRGRSTAYSGTGYAAMRPAVRVVSAAEYQAYVEQLISDLAAAQKAVEGVPAPGSAEE